MGGDHVSMYLQHVPSTQLWLHAALQQCAGARCEICSRFCSRTRCHQTLQGALQYTLLETEYSDTQPVSGLAVLGNSIKSTAQP